MSGFGKCCGCRQSRLLCDFPKVLTDKSQVCAVDLVLALIFFFFFFFFSGFFFPIASN